MRAALGRLWRGIRQKFAIQKPKEPAMAPQHPEASEAQMQKSGRKPTNPVFLGMARNHQDRISYVDLGRRHQQNQIGPPEGVKERRGVQAEVQRMEPQKVFEFEIETRHHNEVGTVGKGRRGAINPAKGPQFRSRAPMTTRRKKDLEGAGVRHSKI